MGYNLGKITILFPKRNQAKKKMTNFEEPPAAPEAGNNENDSVDDNVDANEDENEEEEESIGDFDEEAFRALDAQLDRLNSALDALEEKNDVIHEKAKDLLKSNREVREAIENSDDPPQDAMDEGHADDSK